jgi:hypothetical protein
MEHPNRPNRQAATALSRRARPKARACRVGPELPVLNAGPFEPTAYRGQGTIRQMVPTDLRPTIKPDASMPNRSHQASFPDFLETSDICDTCRRTCQWFNSVN